MVHHLIGRSIGGSETPPRSVVMLGHTEHVWIYLKGLCQNDRSASTHALNSSPSLTSSFVVSFTCLVFTFISCVSTRNTYMYANTIMCQKSEPGPDAKIKPRCRVLWHSTLDTGLSFNKSPRSRSIDLGDKWTIRGASEDFNFYTVRHWTLTLADRCTPPIQAISS